MAEDGEEKLLATVHRIVKSLGRSDTMTEDMLKVFATYDGRLSLDKLHAAVRDAAAPSSVAAAAAAAAAAAEDDASHHRLLAPPLPPAAPGSSSLDRTLRALDRQISQFVARDRLIWSDSADAEAFLEAVDDLIAVVHDLDEAAAAPGGGGKGLLDRAEDLLQRCMFRLEDEFRALIERPDDAAPAAPPGAMTFYSDDSEDEDDAVRGGEPVPIARPVTDFDLIIDALPPGAVSDVHKIARRMVDAGFGRECEEAYAAARHGFLDESVARLGVRARAGAAAEDVAATPWEELEPEVARWIPAFKVVFRIFLPSERRLCDRVFDGLAPYGDRAFAAAVHAPALEILSFGDAVAAASRAPERLFRVIDMYETVRDLIPELDPVLSDPYSAALRAKVAAVCKALGAAINGIFMELENLIRRDPPQVAVPGGGLHPITRYVMNYLRAACASKQTLEEVMEGEFSVGGATPADPGGASSLLAVHIAWIMDVLLKNLETKSKIYQNPPLACVFLMNNGKYIIHKVSDGGELGVLLGDEWARQMAVKVRRWSAEYHRAAWGKVLSVLQTGGGAGVAGGVKLTGKILQQKLRLFYNYLEEICSVQSGWVIVDDQLRADVRAAVAEAVVAAYRGLLAQLPEAAGGEAYIKLSAEEVENRIKRLFEGSRK